jgi:DNA polymerase V
VAKVIKLFITTRRFITTKRFGDPPHYSGGVAGSLPEHTARGAPFVKASRRLLEPICGQGPGYKKAGVCPCDICPNRPHQESLFGQGREEDEDLTEAVGHTKGHTNREHGKGAIGLAAAGLPGGKGNLGREWTMKRQKRSPRYTTRWDELPVAHA